MVIQVSPKKLLIRGALWLEPELLNFFRGLMNNKIIILHLALQQKNSWW